MASSSDGSAIELGVRFRAARAGVITGLRFYKGADNVGAHVGHLWTSNGTLLAEATFVDESATGWQEVALATPVEVSAGTTYVASYHTSGYYAFDAMYFSVAHENPPLRALADGEDGANGVYRYGGAAFPDQTFGSGNYWVDVVFEDSAAPATHRVFPDTVIPPNPAVTDNVPIEVGVKFRASVAGEVRGLRFYKGAANTGTHVGHLWTSGGAMLAEQVFTGETAEGWQEVALATPIAIDPGTTYVASVHSSGYFAYHAGALATGIDAPPLRALANGEDGPNAVYRYGESGFPNSGNGANYFVDLVFAEGTGADLSPPVVSSVAPANGATGIAIAANVIATFNEALDPASLSSASFELRDASSALVAAAVSYDEGARRATLDSDAALAYGATYTARILGGASGVTDVAGNALATDYTWSFTTRGPPPPPPDAGPGGPILVVASAANPFGRYYAEILRTEGLNAFDVIDTSALDAAALSTHALVVLGEQSLTPAQVTLLSDWVSTGGKLVAMRPDKQLAALLGLIDENATLANTYLRVDGTTSAGHGLVTDTLQFHGTADLYGADPASVLATLYQTATTPTAHPAVTRRSVGSSGGAAAAWTFDLARSVVLTRQGNPAWAGQERDGVSPIRSDDLYYGAAVGDPQPDWVDLSKVAIPQADEQQRLFAKVVRELLGQPFPSFWYFPSFRKAVVVMTGDEHACCGGTRDRWNAFLAADPPGCSVADWQCVRGSSYVFPGSGMTDAEGAAFHAQGFELGVHLNTNCNDWTPATLEEMLATQLSTFAAQFPSVPQQSTNRTHCIAWSDWASAPVVELAHEIRLDTNYYYWPGSWVQDRPGFFTGSGMPMRFAATDGAFIDVYQAVTQMTDESSQSFPATIETLLDRALGPEGYYGAFTANMHTDQGNTSSASWAASIVAAAQARGVAVVSGRQMLEWLDGRNASSFGALSWNGQVLGFSVTQGAGARNLRALLPTHTGDGALSLTGLTRGGVPVPWSVEAIKGSDFAVFAAESGSYVATYEADATSPLITSRSAAASPDGTAQITWTTNELASSVVVYGTAPGALSSSASSPGFTTAHAVTLSGLAASTTYYYRVTSADGGGNAANDPPSPGAPASFATPSAVCLRDALPADFAAGTNAGTRTAANVTLAPALREDFGDASLPPAWTVTPWTSGGTAAPVSGRLIVDGARVGPDALYGAGRVLEFQATFAPEAYQHAGLAVGYEGAPWAMFSTGSDGASLKARSNNGSSSSDTVLSLAAPFAPHTFRIEWSASQIAFYVDGALATTHARAISDAMRPLFSDISPNGTPLAVDWLQVTPPHVGAGSFTSRVGDAGQLSSWGAATWARSLPAATSLALSVRTGPTSAPDASWTAFAPIASSGSSIGQSNRYAQYRVDLATSNTDVTPALAEVSLACTPVVTTCGDGVREGAEECDDANTLAGDGCSASCAYESADADGDGLSNADEVTRGTNPLDADSDDDGASDGFEVANGTNPLNTDTDNDGDVDGADNCPLAANAGQENTDHDARGDACDNCRYVANDGQADGGGVLAASPDGIGDACQCGDVSDAVHVGPDGGVNVFDSDEVRMYLARSSTLPASAFVERCPIGAPTGACTVLDAVLLERAVASGDPSPIAQTCRPAVCMADPTDVDADCLLGAADVCLGWATSAAEQSHDTNGDAVPDACQCGDLDRDGDVDLDDEVVVDACSAGTASCDLTLADFNRDGVMNAADGTAFGEARDTATLHTLGCTRRQGTLTP